MDGIINVKKEKGFTSHDVVAKLRGILHQKKIGHTGTLDPDATGVLPVCLGRATKVCELLTDKKKTYIAGVKLGVVTDTQDMTGEILEERPVNVSETQLQEVIAQFTGDLLQTPPMYSAVKVNGKRLYELARKGEVVERKARPVTIYRNELLAYNPETSEFEIQVECSKGTYIRTLCQDMGEKLGCGAAMASLVRTQVDRFSLEEAYPLAEIEEMAKTGTVEEILIPLDAVFYAYPRVIVEKRGMRYLLNGNVVNVSLCKISEPLQDGALVQMLDEEENFYAVYEYHEKERTLTNHKMFYNELRTK